MADAPDRRFTDEQVALVLRTAAELQEREGPRAQGGGLTLAQVEQIAREVGIDPAMVRRAVVRLDARPSPRSYNRFLGGPLDLLVERTVPGELDPTRFEAMLEAVRRATGQLGESGIVGRLFGWKGKMDGARSEVAVSSADGRTTARVRVDLEEASIAHFMTKGALFGVGGGLLVSSAVATAFGPVGALWFVAMAATGYGWARHGFGAAADRYQALATEVIEAVLAAAALETDAGAGEVAPRPPLAELAPGVSPSAPRP